MARRKGFEPLTPRFEVWCSIQLSYRREDPERKMARPKRFELLTPRFVVWCSIQLSYGRVSRGALTPARNGAIAIAQATYWQGIFPRIGPAAARAAFSTCMRQSKIRPLATVNSAAKAGRPSASGTIAISAATTA